MSHMAEADKAGDFEVKWGKKRGVGGKKKEVQFYESFTYDGIEYTLYDCVYMHKEGEPEPYIGKLIKIWENADKTKKVKVQWFFRPIEILNWLGDEKALENEIFLASGQGAGLANINPLEAIAGKCNVVCISKDSRNRQPSEEELKMADFIFYRTFDVEHCMVLDKMDDKVGGLEIKFVFNSKEIENANGVPKLDSDGKEDNKNAIACNETLPLSRQNPPDEFKTVKTDGNYNHLAANIDADVKDSLVKRESVPGDAKDLLVKREPVPGGGEDLLIKRESLPGGKSAPKAGVDSSAVATTSVERGSVSGEKTAMCKVDFDKGEAKASNVPVNQSAVVKRIKSVKDADALNDRPSKKARVDSSIKLLDKKKMNSEKLPVHANDGKALVTTTTSEERTKSGCGKDSLGPNKGVKSAKDSRDSEDTPSNKLDKKALVTTATSFEEKKKSGHGKESIGPDKGVKSAKDSRDLEDRPSNKLEALVTTATSSEGKTKSGHGKDSLGPDKGVKFANDSHDLEDTPSNKLDKKIKKLSNGKLPMASALEPIDEDRETESQVFEITRRPDADKRKWFKAIPWGERIQSAHEQGTLVLLQNLDPQYTSEEVEDIIRHAFKESCTAKMLQRTSISSPHSGQALVIFKTREVAKRVVRKLDEGCLMLAHGRPLVGIIGPPPSLPGKQSTFVGHLVIDKIKQQMQREKEAVSTSHCSQPNTIEYEMAMEWCLLQSRSDSSWERLYKQHGEDLRKLKANLKSK